MSSPSTSAVRAGAGLLGPLYLLLALVVAGPALVACAAAPADSPTATPAPPTATVSPATAMASASTPTPRAVGSGAPATGAPKVTGKLTVFAAASLTDAFAEIGKSIERANPGSEIAFNFAGSPALRTQLGQGARADLFASADQANMQGAQKDGSIQGEPVVFAQNKLVVITPAQPNAVVAQPQDLAKPGLKLVIGTKDLPAGSYARQVVARMSQDPTYGSDFSAKVLANVVSEETNVKNVVSKVQLGEADAGIVYSTDVTQAVRSKVEVVAIPDNFNVIAQYPIAEANGASNQAGAKAFVDYLLSPAGQEILAKYGFLPAPTKP